VEQTPDPGDARKTRRFGSNSACLSRFAANSRSKRALIDLKAGCRSAKRYSEPEQPTVPSLTMRQNRLTSFICATLFTRVRASRGLPTTIARLCARESATFNRLGFNKNSIPRAVLSPELAHIDTITTGASCPCAPQNMEPLHRVGSDIFVVWDGEDLTTDIYLKVAFGLARTLAHRACVADSTAEADFVALDALIEEIAAHLVTLEAIEKTARGVKKNGESILASAQGMRDAVERQVDALRVHVSAVRGRVEG